MQTFSKSGRGSLKRHLSTSALVAAALFGSGIFSGAQAQFFPWGGGGGWGNSQWDDRPRRVRRIPRNVEDDGEKIVSTLPKPTGPLVIVISIGKQTVTIYDGTQKIAISPISSGMPGHDSPTGVFSILEKNRYHYSNLYGGAPMPFMQRVTNSGVAMHQGVVPGYPASHGCIRLPAAFARNLFGITDVGARVIITQDDLTPAEFSSPHLIAPLPPDEQASNDTPARVATAETASATTKDFPSVIGVTQATAAEATDKPRTRAAAAAARAAEKIQLSAAITDAENAKTAAVANAKAMADAARAARDAIGKARAEQSRLKDAADKAVRDAANGADKFKDFTAKLVKVDVEYAHQGRPRQAVRRRARRGDEDARSRRRDCGGEEGRGRSGPGRRQGRRRRCRCRQGRQDRRRGRQSCGQGDRRRQSRARLRQRHRRAQGQPGLDLHQPQDRTALQAKLGMGDPVIDVPVTITNPNSRSARTSSLRSAIRPARKGMRWNVVTVNATPNGRETYRRRHRHEDETYVAPAGDDPDPANALERVEIPEDTQDRLAELLKPGSSFIITDYGLSRETSKRTDFIIEPWRSCTAAPVEYEGGR